jgi:nicotinamidase-related amidase
MITWNGIRRDLAYQRSATALLLVDMQRIWIEPDANSGAEGGRASEYFYEHMRRAVVPNQVRLLEAARAAGVEVVHTIIQSLTRDGRDRSLDHKLSDINVPRDDPRGQIVDALRPADDEIVLPKTSSGVFNSTNIDYVLRNLDIRFLVVAGIVTDQCVDMAVRDAADRGYLVTLVGDACATYTEQRHRAALAALNGYCWTADTATIVARLEQMRWESAM